MRPIMTFSVLIGDVAIAGDSADAGVASSAAPPAGASAKHAKSIARPAIGHRRLCPRINPPLPYPVSGLTIAAAARFYLRHVRWAGVFRVLPMAGIRRAVHRPARENRDDLVAEDSAQMDLSVMLRGCKHQMP
jgi:hypothetical protein